MAYNIFAMIIFLIIIVTSVWAFLWFHAIPIRYAKKVNHPHFKAIEACCHVGLFILPCLFAAYVWAHYLPEGHVIPEEEIPEISNTEEEQ